MLFIFLKPEFLTFIFWQNNESISVVDLIVSGGAASVIIVSVLLILLFASIYIYFERLFTIRTAGKIDVTFIDTIGDHIRNKNIAAALKICDETDTPVARLIKKGLRHLKKPLGQINSAIENAGTLEIYKLEKNVSILATVAGAAPMIGFLGTVIGMILAFHQMASSGGQADMGSLASGIYTAMTTTVAGLIVGIIAYIGYNHMVVRIQKVVHQIEAQVFDFLDLITLDSSPALLKRNPIPKNIALENKKSQ